MKSYFKKVSEYLFNSLESNEILILNFDAEQTDFVRFNHAKIRQAGNVDQATLTLSLVYKRKSLNSVIRLSLDYQKDSVLLLRTLYYLRREIPELPQDPYLMYERNLNSFDRETKNKSLDSFNITDSILQGCHSLDMVGILSTGAIMKGFSNSLGQFNWHESQSFNFDWSMYTDTGKAIKQNYSDQVWDQNIFSSLLDESKQKLQVIDNKEQTIQPGEYRVYLSPSALNEIVDMLSWGGFSYKANKIGSSPLHLMMKGEKKLNKIVSFTEDLTNGISPKFHSDGFIKPDTTELIINGEYKSSLISPRSALEYSVNHNAAEYYESPVSINLKEGAISNDNILATLKDGIYISNLWYLNFSDLNNGRITGLTRFGCFKVSNGEYQGPINTMRFDETVYNIFGDKLIGLTNNKQLLIDSSTYEERSTHSSTIPGAIVEDFKMTL
jgi:predicted Zn-dependent protease|tara:strand:- start:788 stop:2110 length:1323 start_codon:yes stop_codon:yes gene_type:complete